MQRQAIDRDTSRLSPAAERLLVRHAERVAALSAVLDAKDFRRRGWVMATDAGGAPVRSVVELHPADTLALSFVDGEAIATITDVTRGEQP
jgi:exonuclease VII large subunit